MEQSSGAFPPSRIEVRGACVHNLKTVSYTHLMPEESKNATFYQKHGFSIMEDGVAMQIRNPR